MRKYLRLQSIAVALCVAFGSSVAVADNLVLISGLVEAAANSEVNSDDDDTDGDSTNITLFSGGWSSDSTCPPGACLDVASGLTLPTGSASSGAIAKIVGTGGGQYVFPSLVGRLSANTSASVVGLGEDSDADAYSAGLFTLKVDETGVYSLTGSCTGEFLGELVNEEDVSYCYAIVADALWQPLAVAGSGCNGPGVCGAPFGRQLQLEAGRYYRLYVITYSEIETDSSASGEIDMVFSLTSR